MFISKYFWQLIFSAYVKQSMEFSKFKISRQRNSKIPFIVNKYSYIYIHNGKETRTIKNLNYYSIFTIGSLHTTRRTNGK